MTFEEVMHTYFRGERVEALAFILPIGLILVVASVLVLRFERSPFGIGAAVPVLLAGVIFAAVGATVGLRTNRQVAELEQSYAASPAVMVSNELPRMQKVNANFDTTLLILSIVATLGLTMFFAMRLDWARGLGTGLLLVGALGMTIDGIAARRAAPYTEALEALADTAPRGRLAAIAAE